MLENYWERFNRARISRRRALVGAGVAGAGAVAISLAGCGGGSQVGASGGASADKSTQIYKPVDTTSKAKPGGTLRDVFAADRMRLEFDLQKRQSLTHDLIRYMTTQSYNIPRPGTSKNYHLYWPVIQNLGVYRTYPGGNAVQETTANWWCDPTKPPGGNG